ncbi:uncharacterized protein RAG0_13582 [Rhynchosporium agropyri]|uniref:Uncharacterized protein n=1 Tax=Rhynchosporium agropyri TaxID=914238 RepID=A0A1E1LDE2_9HELO|nr:uncharacterized protein RAG0_13582 [Rhynchosporium agropyri]
MPVGWGRTGSWNLSRWLGLRMGLAALDESWSESESELHDPVCLWSEEMHDAQSEMCGGSSQLDGECEERSDIFVKQ